MSQENYREFRFAFCCLVLSCVLWSGNYVLGKLLMSQATTPAAVSFWRFLAAGLVMLGTGLALRRGRLLLSLSRRDWLEVAGQGFFGMSAVGILMFWSEQLTSAINASLLDALIPVAIPAGGLLLGQRLNRRQLLGLGVSLFGCLLVLRVIGRHGLVLSVLDFADLLIVAGAACWAIYVLWGRGTLKRLNAFVYTTWAMIFGALWTLLYALLDHRLLEIPATGEALGLLALLVAGPTLGAFWAWNRATAALPLPLLNITQYLIPVTAMLLAHFLLQEPLNSWQFAGMALIVGGVGLDPAFGNWLRKH